MGLAKETIWFTTKTLSFAVLVLLILFTAVTITGSALPDNVGSGQLDSESPAVYVLDAGHHHPGDGVKPELTPADAEGTFYTKTFVLDRIDGLFLSNIIMLEYIPEAGWGMGLLVFMSLPVIFVAGILLLAYGMWQKRKMKRSDDN
jgi:hypothetical protein